MASLRGFGKAGVALKHLVGRFPRYRIQMPAELAGNFFAETEHTGRFLKRFIRAMMRALREGLLSLNVALPEDAVADATVAEDGLREVLPHNIDE